MDANLNNGLDRVVASSWLLTINSNQSEHATKFEDVLRKLFLSRRILGFFKVLDETGEWYDPGISDIQLLGDKIECSGGIEVGGLKHRIHYHGEIVFYHYGYVHLNSEKLIAWLTQELGYPVNTNCKLSKTSNVGIRNYVNKRFGNRKNVVINNELRLLDGEEEYHNEIIKK